MCYLLTIPRGFSKGLFRQCIIYTCNYFNFYYLPHNLNYEICICYNLRIMNIKHLWSSSSSSIGTRTLSWVLACSTLVEHSQQEGFTKCRCQRHVKPPTRRRTRDLERSNFRHNRPPASEATLANPVAEGGTMGEKWPRNFAESDDLHVTFGFFYMP
jgi:hypothetical protein